MDARSTLIAGGIALPGTTTKDIATSPLEARAYAHPALPGRTVVRLTPSAIGDATDVEMTVLGFGAPSSNTVVGTTVLRSLGFPEWAVVNDPKHARFALEVMQEFRKSARKIKSKPGFARDELVAIAKRLERSVPHFLPSFWEEAGRAFMHEESRSFAAQCFEKARLAEASFKLKVDEDQRSRAYLEFALAGALSTKSLSGYAADLVKAFGPKDGYARFFDLAVQRTRGGVPPWVGMTKELKALAKNASVSADDAMRELLSAVLGAPAIARAPSDFWSDTRGALLALAKKDAAVRTALRHLFPKPSNKTIIDEWIALLEEAGALDAFTLGHGDAATEPDGATAKWADAFTQYVGHRGHREQPSHSLVFRILDRIAPRLVAEGVPAVLANGDGYWRALDSDVIEHALALGISLEPPKTAENGEARTQMTLQYLELDPVRVAAHPMFGPLLVEAVARAFGDAEFEKKAAGKLGLVAARRRWLEERIERLSSLALGALRAESLLLAEKTTAATFAEFPDARERLAAVNAEAPLCRTLQAGLLDELGWPAFEATLAEHAKTQKKKDLKAALFGTMSRPIVVSGTKATIFDGATPGTTVTLPALTKGPHQMRWLGGALLVAYFDESYKINAAWSTDWKDSFELKAFPDELVDFTLPDGSTTLGGRAIHAGDRTFGAAQRLLTDGKTFWRSERVGWGDPQRIMEFDPATGEKVRASWPAFMASRTEVDDELRVADVHLVPAPNGAERSPLGIKDGLLGWYHRRKFPRQQNIGEIGRIDGLVWSGTGLPDALISFPGSERPIGIHFGSSYRRDHDITVLLRDGEAIHLTYGPDGVDGDDDDDDDAQPGEDAPKDPAMLPFSGFSRMPRAEWMHYLVPRDEAGSRALRTISAATCKALLDDVRSATGSPHAAATRAVAQRLPEVSHALLQAGIARALETALAGEQRLLRVLSGSEGAAKGITDRELGEALPIRLHAGYSVAAVSPSITVSAKFLAGEAKVPPFQMAEHAFESALEQYGFMLAFLVSRAATTAHREGLLALLRVFAESPYAAGMTLRLAELQVDYGAPIAKEKVSGRSWLHSEGDSRYFARCLPSSRELLVAEKLNLSVVEAFNGEPQLPKQSTLQTSRIVTTPACRETLLEVIDLVAKRGPVPFDANDAIAFSELSGVPLPEAKLIVAGLPNMQGWASDFLGKELRATLDIKMQDAKAAKAAIEERPQDNLIATLAGALNGVSASALWDCSKPGAPSSWVAAMASALAGGAKGHVQLRSDLVAETRKMLAHGTKPEQVLLPLVDASAPSLVFVEKPLEDSSEQAQDSLHSGVVVEAAEVWRHLALALPIGDPYLTGIVPAVRALRASLLDERTTLMLARCYLEEKQRKAAIDRLDGKPIKVTLKPGERVDASDNGAVVAINESWRLVLLLRTSAVARKEMAAQVAMAEAVAVEAQAPSLLAEEVRFFLSPTCDAWLAELASDRPAGRFAADPDVSAPKASKKLAKALGLEHDAARLYMELLLLPCPTDAFVCEINAWDKKALAAAKKELVAKELVVEGKRERAGRDVFLPGGWEARSTGWRLPVETWKLPFFGPDGATIRGPVGAAYERAVERVTGGDAPKFEEVAAVRKKKGKA